MHCLCTEHAGAIVALRFAAIEKSSAAWCRNVASLIKRDDERARMDEMSEFKTFDCYVNAKRPGIGLYVRAGNALPDFAEPKDWLFDGAQAQDLVPSSVIKDIEANGYALRDMD